MPQRVLIINPPSGLFRRDDRCQSRVEEQTVQVIFPPLDLAYLAAVALEKGMDTRICDCPAEKKVWDDLKELLLSFRPDFFLIKTVAAAVDIDLQAARLARPLLPHTTIIACGEYLSVFAEDCLKKFPELNLAIKNEPEMTFGELLEGKPWTDIKGISFRTPEGAIVENQARPPLENLDQLPLPARQLLHNHLYRSPESGKPLTVIDANRGCHAHCIFCPAGRISHYRFRARSPERIVDELAQCVDSLGIREFLFNGDTFTLNKKWLIELCQLIVQRGLNIRWGCNSRVDTFDEERAQWLTRAGCWVVAFGVESGDQESLTRMKKHTTPDQARRAVDICRRAGLRAHTFFVIGFPWENEASLEKTYHFIRELDPDYFDINIAYPLPGTELYEMALQKGLLSGDLALEQGSYAEAALCTEHLSAACLTRWRKRALLRLYLRPHYIIRTLLYTLPRPYITLRYLQAAFRRLRHLLFPSSPSQPQAE